MSEYNVLTCEHDGLECPLAGCWCDCERCTVIREDEERDAVG